MKKLVLSILAVSVAVFAAEAVKPAAKAEAPKAAAVDTAKKVEVKKDSAKVDTAKKVEAKKDTAKAAKK